MKPTGLKIKPREPLVLGRVRPDAQFLTTHTCIPGRFLRGAWAEWLKMQGKSDEEILKSVDRLRIGNFFPAVNETGLQYALPMPITAMTCKQHPGFRSGVPSRDPRHGVVDTLLPQLAYFLLERAGARMTAPFALECDSCGGRMEPAGGFYMVYEWQGKPRYEQFRPRFHAHTKVAISRSRRASQFHMLYTVNALAPEVPSVISRGLKQVVFLGRVYGDPQACEELITALEHIAIGGLHTRGYGRVEVEKDENMRGFPGLKERVRRFNSILKDLWRDLKRLAVNGDRLPDEPEGWFFSVDLLSPGVFVNNGLPELVPELSIHGKSLRPVWWATRPDRVSGWSTAWGLPKPAHLAACMGSVYVYQWDGSLEELIPTLISLETEGLGLRRDEGYGECLVCHPFHEEVQET